MPRSSSAKVRVGDAARRAARRRRATGSSARAAIGAHSAPGSTRSAGRPVVRSRAARPRRSRRPTPTPCPAVSGTSSVTRCDARPKRCTSACGKRSRRSARCRSVNTGSRAPHSSSTGTSEAADALGDPLHRRAARVVGLERHVGDEVADRRALGGVRVRAGQRAADADVERRSRQRGRAADERRRGHADQPPQRRRAGEPDEGGERLVQRLEQRGVGQHDPGDAARGARGPSPWTRGRPSRARRRRPAVDPERRGQRGRGRPRGRRAGGRAPGGSTSPCRAGRPRRRASPDGPRRGTGARGRTRWGCRGRRAACPRSARPRCRGRASAAAARTRRRPSGSATRPGRGPAGRRRRPVGRRHQMISAKDVLRPEPMPSRTTCCPGLISGTCLASVKGTAAEARLPNVGHRHRQLLDRHADHLGQRVEVDHGGLVRDEPVGARPSPSPRPARRARSARPARCRR